MKILFIYVNTMLILDFEEKYSIAKVEVLFSALSLLFGFLVWSVLTLNNVLKMIKFQGLNKIHMTFLQLHTAITLLQIRSSF